jgi:hypothetical protein
MNAIDSGYLTPPSDSGSPGQPLPVAEQHSSRRDDKRGGDSHRRMPVKSVAKTLETRKVRAVPVLDDQGSVLGVVSEADLLQGVARADEVSADPRLDRPHRQHAPAAASGATAEDMMSSPA